MKMNMRPTITLLLVLMTVTAACQSSNAIPTLQPGQVEIPFEMVVLDDEASAMNFEDMDTDPQVVAITTQDDIAEIESLVTPESVDLLREVDLHTYSALVVFRGMQGCSGFGLAIERLRLQQDTLIIDVQFWQPPPNTACSSVVISPYHIVKLDKSLISLDRVQLALYSQVAEQPRR